MTLLANHVLRLSIAGNCDFDKEKFHALYIKLHKYGKIWIVIFEMCTPPEYVSIIEHTKLLLNN